MVGRAGGAALDVGGEPLVDFSATLVVDGARRKQGEAYPSQRQCCTRPAPGLAGRVRREGASQGLGLEAPEREEFRGVHRVGEELCLVRGPTGVPLALEDVEEFMD